MSGFIVTSAPPNPNGDLHVGHLSGPFLGADVLRRRLAQAGHEVVHVGYADDFSCYVPRRGAELGHTAEATAHVFGRRMEETLSLAAMLQDYFTHPLREPLHADVVQRHFLRLWERGAFEVRELPVFWCERCSRHLYEAEVRGRCQFCGEASDGLYCEECGRPQDTTGLRDARCTRCQRPPAVRSLRRIVFPLDRHRDRLASHYAGRPLRPRLRRYLDEMLARPLPETPISRLSAYGVPVPLPGWEGHILDTWYSGIWGYLAATTAYFRAVGEPDRAEALWREPDTSIVHFIGFDCSFSHALLWPALLLAHGQFQLPRQIVTNEFYRLDGQKFSTSRGHAVWGGDILRRVPADALRFYLCLTGPEREQTSFSVKDFARTVQELLVDGLQPWAQSVVRLVARDLGRVAPGRALPATTLGRLARDLPSGVAQALDPDAFSPAQATGLLAAAIREATAGLDELLGAQRAAVDGEDLLSVQLELLARIATIAAPIMPGWAEHACAALRIAFTDPLRQVLPWPDASTPLLPPGHRIGPDLPTFFWPVAP